MWLQGVVVSLQSFVRLGEHMESCRNIWLAKADINDALTPNEVRLSQGPQDAAGWEEHVSIQERPIFQSVHDVLTMRSPSD